LQDVHGRVAYGGPRQELVKLGKEVDLLIVGSRDYGAIARLVHGSVSRYLVGHATCPLLVLPRGTAEVTARPEAEREEHAVAVSG
jgi:nucleotide-binding universal stress UspA family protein